ncbi:uncharacterized protein LOC110627512 [Manihot esculenta]|uniref:uncharacterized protein LOC110627512 n=1 Tax=Manihot esculenta TaxID=3983 RepID=UPI001CC3C6A5|nr:uncharacterized protein LOC110627512 [Manihot esculenta]
MMFLFAVLLLYSSLLPFIFNLMQFFSSNIGKNYMFLLCNGILVFIVKNSGLVGSSHQDINPINNGENLQKQLETVSAEEQVHEIADKSLVMVEGVDEDDDDEEIGLPNVEELNKKCDDFIRNMKERIKFEAQQLVLVQH